jgi:hypothetical protein
VSLGTILAIALEVKQGFSGWVLAFVMLLILFNPIAPIYLYKKSIWAWIDFVAGLTFLVRGVMAKREVDS